jgi:hypothetical protein
MLKIVNALMNFVYAKDVFVYDYIVAIKIYHPNLYKRYGDQTPPSKLQTFQSLLM